MDEFHEPGRASRDGGFRRPRGTDLRAYAAYRHFWSQTLRSSLVLLLAGEHNPDGAPADTNKATHSAHVNLIWSPVARSDLGIEYIYADRETEDGQKGHLNRLQASAKYAF